MLHLVVHLHWNVLSTAHAFAACSHESLLHQLVCMSGFACAVVAVASVGIRRSLHGFDKLAITSLVDGEAGVFLLDDSLVVLMLLVLMVRLVSTVVLVTLVVAAAALCSMHKCLLLLAEAGSQSPLVLNGDRVLSLRQVDALAQED